jgi:hypothetical protein
MDAAAQNNLSKPMARTSLSWLLPALVCLLFVWAAAPLSADTVTLNSGEVLQGTIISETDTQIEMEVSLYHGSIITKRQVPTTDIKSIVRENLQQQQEKAAYDALSKYTLNPSQQLTPAQYAAGIAAFQKFLATYTNSSYAADVNKRIADWRAESSNVESAKVKVATKSLAPAEKESSNVESGKVKVATKSMAPAEKRTQPETPPKPVSVTAPPESLQTLTNRLAGLQADRNKAAEDFRVAQSQLTTAQKQLESLKDTREPKLDPATKSQMTDFHGNPEFLIIPNPEKPNAQSRVDAAQKVVGHARDALSAVERKIADVQAKIRTLQPPQQPALVKSNAPPKQVVAKAQPSNTTTNAPPTRARTTKPTPPKPAPEPPPPWYIKLWNWVHG